MALAFYLYLARSIECCAVRSLELATYLQLVRKKVSVLQVFYGLGPTVSDFGFSENRLKTVKPFQLTSDFILFAQIKPLY